MRSPARFCTILFLAAAMLIPIPAFAAFGGPAELVPTQSALPEPWGLLKLILLLTFTIHILLVNILVGSCMMALAGSLRQKSALPFSMKEETAFITKVLALAVNFGVAPYLFMQVLYGSFFYPSTLLMSAWWMSIIGFVMLSYYGLYIVSDKSAAGLGGARPILAVLTLMLLATAFLLTSNSSLMLRPENWLAWIREPGGTVLNTGDPTFIPRYLHIVFASAAIGGLAHALIAEWKRKKTADPARTEAKISRGLAWFGYATIAQILTGLWFFLSLSPEVRKFFMGGSAISTIALILALVGAALVLALAYRRQLRALAAAGAAQVFVMVVVRDIVRDVTLLPYFEVKDSPEKIQELAAQPLALENGQHIGFALFLICAVLAVFFIIWMAKSVSRAVREGEKSKAGAASALEE